MVFNTSSNNRTPKTTIDNTNLKNKYKDDVNYLNRAFISDTESSSIPSSDLGNTDVNSHKNNKLGIGGSADHSNTQTSLSSIVAGNKIFNVSKKYSNDDQKKRHHDPNTNILGANNKGSRSHHHHHQKSRNSNSNDPKQKHNKYLQQDVDLLNPSSIIIDASSVEIQSSTRSSRLNNKIASLSTLSSIQSSQQLKQQQQQLQPNRRRPSPSELSETSSLKRLVYKLKNPFCYIPIIIVVLICIVGIIAGATYLFLFKYSSSSNVDTSKTSSSIKDSLNSMFQYNNTKNLTLPACGNPMVKPNLAQVRIIGGYRALAKSWPWTVSIAYFGSRTSLPHACGGSLINKRFVITATHCAIAHNIYGLVGQPVQGSDMYGSLAQMMRVYVGVTTRSTDVNYQDTYRVLSIKSYPNFDGNSFQNDLTILELDKDVAESESVGYICLTKDSQLDPGNDVYAVGWGFTNNNFYAASDSLMQVKFQVQSVKTCGLAFMPIVQFCAGNPTLVKDTCNGDSGGPIMQYLNNKWNLVGIVSNGDAMCTGKGIYTNISNYYDWILENIVVTS